MDRRSLKDTGYYGVLGVPPAARQREIELAFRHWGDRLAAGIESAADYRRAEAAYHVLSVPRSRAVHDRQLGLSTHPAWREERVREAGECVQRALRELGCGRAARARLLLDRAVSRVPDDPVARSYLALALVKTGGDLHEAARHGRYAIERRPREAPFFFNLAEVYEAAGLRSRAFAMRASAWKAVVATLLGRVPRL